MESFRKSLPNFRKCFGKLKKYWIILEVLKKFQKNFQKISENVSENFRKCFGKFHKKFWKSSGKFSENFVTYLSAKLTFPLRSVL